MSFEASSPLKRGSEKGSLLNSALLTPQGQGKDRHCGLWPSGRHAWSGWRRVPLGTREWSTVGRRRAGENGLICLQESPGSVNNEIEGPLVEIGSRSVLGNLSPVPGSPRPRELAVADGSVRKYRMGPWSSWGIRSENGQRPVGDGQRGMVTSGPEPAGRGLSHEQARDGKPVIGTIPRM